MTWHEAKLSLQLAAEERRGWLVREVARMRRAQEDAAWDAAVGATSGPG